MLAELPIIPLRNLAVTLIPVAAVLAILWRWSLAPWSGVYALGRMLAQLLVIGYVLTFVFQTDQPAVVGLVLTVMLLSAGWIALRTVDRPTWRRRGRAVLSILIGGGITLGVCTQVVLSLETWFEPRYVVPLAGMALANAMNTVSLAAERFEAETGRGAPACEARATAMRACMIPATNALLAVGLVSIPGMMTGQVLAGVDPLIAARYQIMVMAMVYGSAGLSGACYLWFESRHVGAGPLDKSTPAP